MTDVGCWFARVTFGASIPTHLANVGKHNNGGQKNDRLLIDNVELLRDGCCCETSSKESGTSLADESGLGRQVVDDFGGLLLWGRVRRAGH